MFHPRSPKRFSSTRPAFSLIEILVVISIIALLVGISLPVALRLLGATDLSRTRTLLQGLSAAADEYSLATGGLPDHRVDSVLVPTGNGGFADVDIVASDNDAENNTLGIFLSRALKNDNAGNFIRSAAGTGSRSLLTITDNDPNTDNDEQSFDPNVFTIVDRWGTPIRYARFVSYEDDNDRLDNNRRLDENFPDDDYLPRHPNAFFASAGPDGEWGTHDLTTGEPDAQAEDNLYSYQLD